MQACPNSQRCSACGERRNGPQDRRSDDFHCTSGPRHRGEGTRRLASCPPCQPPLDGGVRVRAYGSTGILQTVFWEAGFRSGVLGCTMDACHVGADEVSVHRGCLAWSRVNKEVYDGQGEVEGGAGWSG